MDTSRFDNMSIENAINMIKQKHFKDLDATDFAFLKARESYLTESDKAIYLEGQDPYEVVQGATPITREERIINENRPLQDQEMAIRAARNEAARLEAEAVHLPVGEARTEAQEKLAEERSEHAKNLETEVKVAQKEAEKAEKEAKKGAKEVKDEDK